MNEDDIKEKAASSKRIAAKLKPKEGRAAKEQARQNIDKILRLSEIEANNGKTKAAKRKHPAEGAVKPEPKRPKKFYPYKGSGWKPVTGSSHNVATSTRVGLTVNKGERVIIAKIEVDNLTETITYHAVRQPRGFTQGTRGYANLLKPDPQGRVGGVVKLENLQKGEFECEVKIEGAGAGNHLGAYERPRPACGSTWPSVSDLVRHMRQVHKMIPPPELVKEKKKADASQPQASCTICQKEYTQRGSLNRHMQKHIKDDKKEDQDDLIADIDIAITNASYSLSAFYHFII